MPEDYRDLPPVPPVERPESFRQSFMRQMDSCPRSAYLGLKYGEGPHAHQLDRGTALHRVVDRMVAEWVEAKETWGDAGSTQISEMSGNLVDEVLDEGDLQVRQVDADAVRAMAYHLAIGIDVDPTTVLGIERPFETIVEGERLTATVDLLYEVDAETLGIVDWKSGFGIPSQDEFEHSFYGFQLRFYAWIAQLEMSSYKRVWARCVFPRRLRDDGTLHYRELWLDKQRLQEFGRDMERLTRKVDRAFTERFPMGGDIVTFAASGGEITTERAEGQKWTAIAGDHCAYCPCEAECPLPAKLRRWAGLIQQPEQAAEALEWADRMKDRVAATTREARKFLERHGPLEVGNDVYFLNVSESQGLRKVKGRSDWEGMAEAVAAGTFDRAEWIQRRTETRLTRVPRAAWEKRQAEGAE